MGLEAMQHVLVLSDDIDETRDFYVDVLGLHTGPRPDFPFTGHWIYIGDAAVVHIAGRESYAAHAATLGATVSPAPDGAGPIDHVAFAGRDYDAISARLDAHGVEPIRNEIPNTGVRQLFVHDPNGVRVEINVAPG